MGTIIGIDLGTTNSVVAVMDGNEPRVLVNEEGQRVTPSVVAFDERSDAVVGAVARRQCITNPERTIASVKRFMGRRFSECSADAAAVSYDVVEHDDGGVRIRVNDRLFAPPEISAKIIAKLVRAAEAALGGPVDGAVITVPAYFNDAQRQATRHAGSIAGLDVKRIINEPTAAALAFGIQQAQSPQHADGARDRRIVVFDFGGGTFDVSVLELSAGVVEVRATAGDTQLGGDDIDLRIQRWLLEELKTQTGVDAAGDRMVAQRLRDAAERAKAELSVLPQTEINLPFLVAASDGPKHLRVTLSRARLEQMIADLVGRTIACCERVLADAGLAPAEIDDVLLVGGSTRIPLVAERVRGFFGREPNRSLNPDEAVALGAAVQGAILGGAGLDIILLDVTPLSLGVETRGGLFTGLIERNTTIPTRAQKTFSTAVDQQQAIEVHVLQGEREFARENRSLGRFELTGLPPLPRAQPRIDVVFEIDANGIVAVSATERSTGVEAGIRITGAGGLAAEEVGRMIADAEAAKRGDEERRALIERRNALESSLLRLRQRSDEVRGDLTEPTLAQVEESTAAAATALGAEILDDARYLELNRAVLAAAALVEDDAIGAASRRRGNAADAPKT